MTRLLLACITALIITANVTSQTKPAKDYLVYVLSESADRIALIRFGPKGARVDHDLHTGEMPSDINGPHGIAVAPDKNSYYVTLGHGRPFGTVWKYSVDGDRVLGKTTLGFFPATVDISRDGDLLFIVNFNLHGDMIPSSVSVVATEPMIEVARITTCTMPHGSRLNAAGTKHYSACMMDDVLVEIDTHSLKVSRNFLLTKGHELGKTGPPVIHRTSEMKGMDMSGHGMEAPKPGTLACSPTWAQPSVNGASIFVACNQSSEIVEIDANKWSVIRRIPARPGVYNLAVTHDGTRLLGTNKRDQSVSIFDIKSGKELARLPTRRKVLHGIVVSPDDSFAPLFRLRALVQNPGTVNH